MIRVALVEDEMLYRKQLEEYLIRYSEEYDEKFEIEFFSDGDEIVECYTAQFDIVLLDIQMQFMDGMSAAKEIRKSDPEVVIIFITNMAQYAIQGYEVDALDYILKPIAYFSFSQRLERAISRMKRRTRQFMAITLRNGTQKLDVREIYYIESQGHNLIFHAKNGNYTMSGTMKAIEEKLANESFYRCNRGYLVNLEHVSGVRDGCAIVHDEMLLISRARKKDFMQALVSYIGDVVK